MGKLIIILALCVIILILSATPLFRGRKLLKECEEKGLRIMRVSRGKILLFPALGIFCMVFVVGAFFLVYIEYGLEEGAGLVMLLYIGGVILMVLVPLLLCSYCLYKRHILYDNEKILIGQVFRPYKEIRWYEISKMNIKNQDFFDLYDRDGKRCVSANANMEGYHAFYQTAMYLLKPEYRTDSMERKAYQKKFTVSNGCGKLCYRTGEYYAGLILMLLCAGLMFLMPFTSGESLQSTISYFIEAELYGALFVSLAVLGCIIALVYVKLQKITYDREKIVIKRFPRRTVTLRWQEIVQLQYTADYREQRRIILHTPDKKYIIREDKFRQGFSEVVNEINTRHQGKEAEEILS